MRHGRQIVATVGTPVQFDAADDTLWSRIDCQALVGNAGYICIGGSNVRASVGSQNAIALDAIELQTFTNIRLSELWVDADTANDGVAFVCQ